jgi:long-chain acyl-CoA synthetase
MADTIARRLLATARAHPSAVAYYTKQRGAWQPTTWQAFVSEVRATARALIALGVGKGDRVAILGFNRPEWTIFDLAAMMAGAVPAGIYTTCSKEEVHYILEHSEAAVVLVEDDAQLRKVLSRHHELASLRAVVLMRGAIAHETGKVPVLTWEELQARAISVEEADLERRMDASEPNDLATLIYTSGTTGPPKAVMLSQHNLSWTATQLANSGPASISDCLLSYLPLSHIAEQMATILLPASVGSAVYYAESIERVADNLKEAQPTVFFGVPRIWEKFHAAMTARLGAVSGFKGALLRRARNVCLEVHLRREAGQQISRRLRLEYRILTRLVTDKIKQAVGLRRVRHCVTGAAPTAKEILEFFASIDLPIQEIYGQSEVTGPTSFNLPHRGKLGTVGPPMEGVEVKISEDGEVLVRGPNLFMGYFKDPEATAAAFRDGWLCSGDLGALDEHGFLHITGRKKEIIITAGGKNITPYNIEEALKESPLISEAVVIGDRRKFLTALITLDEAAAAQACAGVSGAAAKDEALRLRVQQIVEEVNPRLARVEQIKRFTIVPGAFSIDGGELTPTLKLRRAVISAKYQREIEEMYRLDAP